MRQLSSRYSISRLIAELIQTSANRDSEFVRLIGYRRISSGLRALNCWLQDGQGDPFFLKRLTIAFPARADEIGEAARDTALQKENESELLRCEREEKIRLLHRPCLIANTNEETPSQLVFYALFGRDLKNVPLPARIALLPNPRAFEIVRWRIRRYLRQYSGVVPFWGPAISFLYSKRPDENYLFSLDGTLLREEHELPKLLRASVKASIGRTTIIDTR